MAKDRKKKKTFFKDFKAELKKVIWPTPKQIVNNTIAVIVIVLITAVIVFVLDLTFDLFNKQGVDRLKSVLDNRENIVNTVDDGNTTDDNNTTENTDNNNIEEEPNSEIDVNESEVNE